MARCELCREQAREVRSGNLDEVVCDRCGTYKLGGSAAQMLSTGWQNENRWLLSCITFNASRAKRTLVLTADSIPELVESAPKPSSFVAVTDDVLLALVDKLRRGGSFSGQVRLSGEERRLFYLRSAEDLLAALQALERRGFVSSVKRSTDVLPTFFCDVTIDGWERAENIERGAPDTRQAFVAMSFDEMLTPAYREAIEPAIVATGYTPFRSDLVHYNAKIDDKIVAELKRSAFIVADFTQHKSGVYFECGFALGRGLDVIWCCRKDHLDGTHFDTRQYNHIVWTDIPDLRERLTDRIRATIPSWDPAKEPRQPGEAQV